jgi:hypothetical protein
MSSRFYATLVALAMVGCDRKGTDLLPDNSAFAPVVTIGELRVMNADDYWSFRSSSDPHQWCSDEERVEEANGARPCFYGQLGMPEAGVRGGASYTFTVPTIVAAEDQDPDDVEQLETVCVLMDPETVFWNHSVAELDREIKPMVADYHDDDGDLDMDVGLSSYYTGSPGVELGDFRGLFTDSLGRTIEIEYGECIQTGSPYPGEHHSGRGTLEYCDIDVEGRQGLQFTVVMETFSVPLNDGALGYGTLVYGGRCRDITSSPREEQVIPEESLVAEPPEDGDFKTKACTKNLELAVSSGFEQGFCCVHPEMCSDRAPLDACDGFSATYDPTDEDYLAASRNFCSHTAVFTPNPGLTIAEHNSYVNQLSGDSRTDPTLSLVDYGYQGASLCCDDYSVVDFDSSDLLLTAPELPDAISGIPQDEWADVESTPGQYDEYRIPWNSVGDYWQ